MTIFSILDVTKMPLFECWACASVAALKMLWLLIKKMYPLWQVQHLRQILSSLVDTLHAAHHPDLPHRLRVDYDGSQCGKIHDSLSQLPIAVLRKYFLWLINNVCIIYLKRLNIACWFGFRFKPILLLPQKTLLTSKVVKSDLNNKRSCYVNQTKIHLVVTKTDLPRYSLVLGSKLFWMWIAKPRITSPRLILKWEGRFLLNWMWIVKNENRKTENVEATCINTFQCCIT